MTKQELNRDIKRLANYAKHIEDRGVANLEVEEARIKKELSRLYYADDKFEAVTLANLRRLLRLNLRWRAIPLHLFGVRIEL